MSRVCWLLLCCAIATGAAVGAVPRPPAAAVVRGTFQLMPVDDPFPIRRVRGTDTRLPEFLKELEPGPVVRLPRQEFESRVRAAGRVVARTNRTARIVDATYIAELDGSGDLTGTANITILNTSGATGFMPLDPLRLAVSGAKWADGGEAALAVPVGATAPGVWLERDGRRVLQLQWSLASITEPGERRFELRVPASQTSTLEVNLPVGQVPTAAAEVLLTGPFEAPGKPAQRLWRMRFGGRAKLEFAIRTGAESAGIATAALVAKYELSPGQLLAAFEYELRPARGSVAEWSFTADPALRITDVVANNRAGWTVDPPLVAGGPRRVRVTLRQPGPGGKVLISAVAPMPDSTLPVVRPSNAVIESENMELRLASSLKLESWSPGDYRLTDVTTSDQARVLSLTGTLLPPGADQAFRHMPSVRAGSLDAEFTTHERLEWRLDPKRSSLVARVHVRVTRGPLFQLVVRPPPGYTLDRGTLGSDELIAYTGTPTPAGQAIEFVRPVLAGQQAELRLEFRGGGVKPGEAVPFPALAVLGANMRDGWLSIAADAAWSIHTRPAAGATAAGLWGWFATDAPRSAHAVYAFRAKEPDGTATIVPARPTISANAAVRIDAQGEAWRATTRFTLSATGGVLPTVVVFVPGPLVERTWKLLDSTNAIADTIPIPAEMLPLPLFDGFARIATARGAGTVWVFRFARPLTDAAVLETAAQVSDNAVPLPVPRLLGANQTTVAEVAPDLKSRVSVEVTEGTVRLKTLPPSALGANPVSDVYLLTAVRAPGEAVVAFGGTVRDSRGGMLPVTLPLGAEVRGVCVAGQWLNIAACAVPGSLSVPLPVGPAVRFEVRYRLPRATGWPTHSITSSAPEVPGAPLVRRWWSFATGTLPGWPSRPWDATTHVPPLLGGPLVSTEPALIIQSDDEWVRVGAVQTADALAIVLITPLLALAVVASRRRRVRGALVLATVMVAAVAVAQLGPPWWARIAWPVLGAAVVALGGVLVAIGIRTRPAVATAAFLLFALCSLHAIAQQPAVATVLILPDAMGKEEIVAPRALLDRLDALARPSLPVPAIVAAAYDVKAEDAESRVTAKFLVRAFRASDNVVSLPLSDVRLDRVTVNGIAAFPTAPRPDVYAIALPGPGRHEIEVRFAATATTAGPEREVRFGVPEVADAQLLASLPGAARQPQAVGRVGRQSVVAVGDRATVAADLGTVKSVHLRWREGAAGAAVLKVREGCVWDVHDAGAALTAAYLVRVEQGTITGLRFDIPAELEVLRVSARSTDPPAAPLALRDWTLAPEKDGTRLLRIDFQGPTGGRLLVVLECAPRKPIGRQPVLRFPRVAFGNVKGETEAVYGLRATRVVLEEVARVGVLDFPADALRDFSAVPDLKLDPSNPVRAFRLVPSSSAELRPLLRVGEPPAVRTATAWQVGPHRADATGTVSWSAREPLAFLEFNIATAKVLEVRGPEVSGWTQSSTRVQVWLRAGVRDGTIEWSGTAVPAPLGAPLANPLLFEPTQPKVSNARLAADEVRMQPIDGWTLRIDRARGWQAVPGTEIRYRTDMPTAPTLRVQVLPSLPAR